jgi:ring-1,2-phenylacetyl-CoA epoxidase subunit PaaD
VVTAEQLWQALEEVKDPEIPVVSVVGLGVIRDISVAANGAVTITMTPTFAGCPALAVMRRDVEAAARALGATDVTVTMTLSPPWTTDWIRDDARAALKAFGLAPPLRHGGNVELVFYEPVACPRCGSSETTIRNTFGPTLCRAIYYCHRCQDAFEQIKAL